MTRSASRAARIIQMLMCIRAAQQPRCSRRVRRPGSIRATFRHEAPRVSSPCLAVLIDPSCDNIVPISNTVFSRLLCCASHGRAAALRPKTAHCRSLVSHSRPAVSVSCASGPAIKRLTAEIEETQAAAQRAAEAAQRAAQAVPLPPAPRRSETTTIIRNMRIREVGDFPPYYGGACGPSGRERICPGGWGRLIFEQR